VIEPYQPAKCAESCAPGAIPRQSTRTDNRPHSRRRGSRGWRGGPIRQYALSEYCFRRRLVQLGGHCGCPPAARRAL